MKKKLKTICIIPARGGSKGLPGKNIKIFNGKPLIAWPILAATQCEKIDQILVTTDSNEIAKKAVGFGAKRWRPRLEGEEEDGRASTATKGRSRLRTRWRL